MSGKLLRKKAAEESRSGKLLRKKAAEESRSGKLPPKKQLKNNDMGKAGTEIDRVREHETSLCRG